MSLLFILVITPYFIHVVYGFHSRSSSSSLSSSSIIRFQRWNRLFETSTSNNRKSILVSDDIFSEITQKHIRIGNIPLSNSISIRGVVSTEPIYPNDVILSVPSMLAIETTNAKPPSTFPDFVSQELWEKSRWDHRLAFKLLYDKFVLQDKSILYSWIKTLPNQFTTTYNWSDDNFKQLQYLSLQPKVLKQRMDWLQVYQTWKSSTSSISTSSTINSITFDDFVWALQCVNSRTFSGSYEGSSATERRALLLFTGLLTFIWPILHLGTYEQALGAAISVGISIITRDLFISKFLSLKRYVMCPYIDMINHNSYSQSEVSYNYFQDKFEVKSQAYHPMDQIFISYGKQSNDRFLQYYGFIENNNPNDLYDFGENLVSILLKYGEELDTKISLPQLPTPSSRLEYIIQSLKQTSVSQRNIKNGKKSLSVNSNEDREAVRLATSTTSAITNDLLDLSFSVITADQLSCKLYSQPLSSSSSLPNILENNVISHFDEISVRVMRALYSSEMEWKVISSMGMLEFIAVLEKPLSLDTEEKVRKALSMLAEIELAMKETSLEEDKFELMKLLDDDKIDNSLLSSGFSKSKNKSNKVQDKVTVNPSGVFNDIKATILSFRIEKKNILQKCANL